jgi:hypothetical protein
MSSIRGEKKKEKPTQNNVMPENELAQKETL